MSAASATSAALATAIGLPLSSDSSSASSSAYFEIRSPMRQIILPRSEGVMVAHGPDSRARRAACTAASMSALSPSATRAMTLPVAGFMTSKVLPETAGTHLPLMSIFFGVARNCVTGLDVGISLRTALIVMPPDDGLTPGHFAPCATNVHRPAGAAPTAGAAASTLAGDPVEQPGQRFGFAREDSQIRTA